MEITVYQRQDGNGYILVPDFFLPSMECRQRHGALRRCGQITNADALCEHSWRQVVWDIDRHTYALLDAGQARRLLGADHPWLARTMSAVPAPERTLGA